MFTMVRRALCLVIIGALVFVAIALWNGGEKFRKLGRETGGAIQKGGERLAEKADRIKEKRDATTSAIKKWTGKGSPGKEEAPGGENRTGQRKEAKDSGTGEEKVPGKGEAAEEEKGFFRGLMDTAWEKVRKFVREMVSDDERPHKS